MNELSIASFYCKHFTATNIVTPAAAAAAAATTTTTTTIPSSSSSGDKPNERFDKQTTKSLEDVTAPTFWEEDIWTDQDEENALRLLNENIGKCSIDENKKISIIQNDNDAWNQFYSNHQTKFFKDRHYLEKAFPNEFSTQSTTTTTMTTTTTTTTTTLQDGIVDKYKTLVELGCGVGNAILPLMESTSHGVQWKYLYGLDLSTVAIDLLRNDSRFIEFNNNNNGKDNNDNKNTAQAAYALVCDISKSIPDCCKQIAHVTTLLFCLSAIDPEFMEQAVQNAAQTLQPGGILVFRDYGRYDEAQLKLGVSRNKQMKENFYQKHDGTKCFYFSLNDCTRLFCSVAGLQAIELRYIRRVYTNHATNEKRRRVWVQGRFRMP